MSTAGKVAVVGLLLFVPMKAARQGAGRADADENILNQDGVPLTVGQVWVPGGMKALAAAAHLEPVPTRSNFYSEFCRAIVRETQLGAAIPHYMETLQAYMDSVAKLASEGERVGDRTVIVLSISTAERRKKTARILPLLGWKLVKHQDGSFGVEPGDQPADGPRQSAPAVLGIDEIGMQETLEAGGNFQFEIVSEVAPLIGSAAWSALRESSPGGLAGVFVHNIHTARVCAGFGAMGQEAASILISTMGLRALVKKHSNDLGRYAAAFVLSEGKVMVPGGVQAEPVWEKLVGASPRDPPSFLRGLLGEPERKLAAFYCAVWRSDEAHRQFFTRNGRSAERFLAWYQKGDEFQHGEIGQADGWRTEFIQALPLDAAGNVRFPGGRRAWTSSSSPKDRTDDDVLLESAWLEAFVPVARLEQQRKVPLDEDSAKLLAQHYSEWRPLFPYFAKLTGLGAGEFAALAEFANAVAKYPEATRNIVMAEWNSLLELIARGVAVDSLEAVTGARAFRAICDGAAPSHSDRALEILSEIAGGTDLNEAVPSRLLGLNGARRSSFDRVLEVLKAPRLGDSRKQTDPTTIAAALSALVYAVSLDPDTLLVRHATQLLSRHQFVPKPSEQQKHIPLFSASALVKTGGPMGAYFAGGFANFEEASRGLPLERTSSRVVPSPPDEVQRNPSAQPAAEFLSELPTFRVSKLAVKVNHLVVNDSKGRYVDTLTADQFTVLDEGRIQTISSFESRFSKVSVALLLDTTGSMYDVLPAVKNAALKLIGDLRPEDAVAVYRFSDTVTEVQTFTSDMAAAKRAVMRTYADGATAMYDALARASHDLEGQNGKKVIILFTDGNDNNSALSADAAVQIAKTIGVPVYTIAQGEALWTPAYLKLLEGVSKATGGVTFPIHSPGDIAAVFQKVSEELTHGYYLLFEPEGVEEHTCHTIKVTAPKGYTVRAREAYCAD